MNTLTLTICPLNSSYKDTLHDIDNQYIFTCFYQQQFFRHYVWWQKGELLVEEEVWLEEQKKKEKNKMDLSGLHRVYKEEGHNKFILYLYIRLIICEEEHVLELLSAVEFLSP